MTQPTPEALQHALATLQAALDESPRQGLPLDLFLFVSRLTPLVNVDLLIRDEAGRFLLTWRHDAFYGPGWHVPGGIIRFKEDAAQRIAAVADSELGAQVQWAAEPLCLQEIINHQRDTRGHFISFLYACTLTTPLDPGRAFDPAQPANGAWGWHTTCPDKLIDVHDLYRPWLKPPGEVVPGPRSAHLPQRHWNTLAGRYD